MVELVLWMSYLRSEPALSTLRSCNLLVYYNLFDIRIRLGGNAGAEGSSFHETTALDKCPIGLAITI